MRSELTGLMRLRVRTCEYGCMGHNGCRRLRVGLFEDDALARQTIEIESNSLLCAEKAHAVTAGGIDRNENDVRLRRCGKKFS